MQTGQFNAEQRQIPYSVYKHIILWGGDIMIRGEPRAKKSTGIDDHATTKM